MQHDRFNDSQLSNSLSAQLGANVVTPDSIRAGTLDLVALIRDTTTDVGSGDLQNQYGLTDADNDLALSDRLERVLAMAQELAKGVASVMMLTPQSTAQHSYARS